MRGASNHSAFMGKWSTVISLTNPEDELSFKEMRMWGVNQEKWEARRAQDYQHQWQKASLQTFLLDRVAFWIVYIAWRAWYKLVAYNAISVRVRRQNGLFLCMCNRNCIIIVIINIIVYIVVVVVCQNRQVNGPNKCKHEISDTLHYSIIFILFCYTKLRTDPTVNKDSFLFEFFSKDSLSCSKVGVCLNTYLNKIPAFKFFFQSKSECTTLLRRC